MRLWGLVRPVSRHVGIDSFLRGGEWSKSGDSQRKKAQAGITSAAGDARITARHTRVFFLFAGPWGIARPGGGGGVTLVVHLFSYLVCHAQTSKTFSGRIPELSTVRFVLTVNRSVENRDCSGSGYAAPPRTLATTKPPKPRHGAT